MLSNTEQLKTIMKNYDLSISQVAKLLRRSEQTVRTWRCKYKTEIPDHMLEALQFRLMNKTQKERTVKCLINKQ